MVLEHLPSPQLFWDKLHEVLTDGGVFWGLTVDARHLFSRLSLWSGRLRIKNSYLDFVLGRTEQEARYKNYPTYYRSNTPREIAQLANAFRSCECINFSRVGQWSPYLPKRLRRFADEIDRRSIRKGPWDTPDCSGGEIESSLLPCAGLAECSSRLRRILTVSLAQHQCRSGRGPLPDMLDFVVRIQHGCRGATSLLVRDGFACNLAKALAMVPSPRRYASQDWRFRVRSTN